MWSRQALVVRLFFVPFLLGMRQYFLWIPASSLLRRSKYRALKTLQILFIIFIRVNFIASDEGLSISAQAYERVDVWYT